MKRFLCVLLTVLVLMTTSLTAFAASSSTAGFLPNPGIISPMYTHIALVGAGLSISSMGRATCGGSVILSDGSCTCSMSIKLQRYTSSWTTVKTWTYSGEDYLDETEYYYITSGYDYRVLVNVSVYNAGGTFVEGASAYSNTVSY